MCFLGGNYIELQVIYIYTYIYGCVFVLVFLYNYIFYTIWTHLSQLSMFAGKWIFWLFSPAVIQTYTSLPLNTTFDVCLVFMFRMHKYIFYNYANVSGLLIIISMCLFAGWGSGSLPGCTVCIYFVNPRGEVNYKPSGIFFHVSCTIPAMSIFIYFCF